MRSGPGVRGTGKKPRACRCGTVYPELLPRERGLYVWCRGRVADIVVTPTGARTIPGGAEPGPNRISIGSRQGSWSAGRRKARPDGRQRFLTGSPFFPERSVSCRAPGRPRHRRTEKPSSPATPDCTRTRYAVLEDNDIFILPCTRSKPAHGKKASAGPAISILCSDPVASILRNTSPPGYAPSRTGLQ